MADQTQPQAAVPLDITPEAVASALALLGEVAKGFAAPGQAANQADPAQPNQAQPSPTTVTATPLDLGRFEEMAGALSPALYAVPESRLKSSRLWTLIGTVAALAIQHPIGLELPPITQVCIAGVAAIYIIARSVTGAKATEA